MNFLSSPIWLVTVTSLLTVGCALSIWSESKVLGGRWRLTVGALIVLGFAALAGALWELKGGKAPVALQLASSGIALISLPRVVYGAQHAHEETRGKLDELGRELAEVKRLLGERPAE
jgi:hypothetical protein